MTQILQVMCIEELNLLFILINLYITLSYENLIILCGSRNHPPPAHAQWLGKKSYPGLM